MHDFARPRPGDSVAARNKRGKERPANPKLPHHNSRRRVQPVGLLWASATGMGTATLDFEEMVSLAITF